MEDTGWRRNKYGGWFNINDINKNKSQRYTVIHKTKIGEEVGENYGTLEEGIDYYQKFFNNPKSYELQDEKGNKIDINKYMNNKIRNQAQKTKTYELYHGTKFDFNEFDDQYIGKRSLGGLTYGKGHYFLAEPSDTYGQQGYKVKVTLKNPYIVQERKWSSELTKMGYDWFDFNRPDPSDLLASKGYDATIIMNDDKIAEVIVYSNKDKKIKIQEKFKNY